MKRIKQIEQSKAWFLEALLGLMEKESFETITVKQIAASAQLDRRTFYRHFASKEEIINYRVKQLLANHFVEIKKLNLRSEEEIIRQHFYFLEEHIQFVKILKKQQLFSFLLDNYAEYTSLFATIFPGAPLVENESNYQVTFKAGGFLNVVSHWLEQEQRESPVEMAELLTHFYRYGVE
ncbi:TetR/AcrR family transcriptional regulator [Enterococcus sp. AZ109]|uniref:TetR/AcrR family transcriptional regulator n=1 Tax=Enterococcus sp. AZ109 TaxID=2774634 RepID=UPI003F1F495E